MQVSEDMLAHFKPLAEEALTFHEGDALSALAAALALVAGFPRPIQGRSLLSGVEGTASLALTSSSLYAPDPCPRLGYRTVCVTGPQPIASRGYAVSALSRDAGEQGDGKGLELKDCRVPHPMPVLCRGVGVGG